MIHRSRGRRPLLVAVPLVLSIAFAPIVATLARADDAAGEAAKKEARAHYDRGVQLYKEAAYEAALVEFERAYQLVPSFRILYNMGQIRYEMNSFAAALKLFRRYLADGGTDVPQERKVEVEKRIAELELRVATVTVTVDTPDALVRVDDVVIGKSPLKEPLVVDIGYRKITAAKDGKTDTKIVSVAGGDKIDVALSVAGNATAPIEGTPTPSTSTKSSSIPWVPWAITGALTASAVVMGLLTLKKMGDLSNERSDPNATRDSLDSALSREKTFAITTDVLAAGAVIAGGVSLYFTFASKSPSAKNTGASSIQVGVGPGSVALFGAF